MVAEEEEGDFILLLKFLLVEIIPPFSLIISRFSS